ITFLRGYFENIKFSGVSQGWSLTVEETFYFLAPLIFILIKRSKLSAVLLPFLFLALGFLLVRIFQGNSPYGFMNSNQFMLRYTFLGRSAEFFTGIGLALIYKKYQPVYATRYLTYIGVFFSVLFIVALSILGKGYSGAGHPIGMFINSVLLPVFGFAPLFWGLMSERNFICSALSSKFFVLLGKSSYIFYLIHIGIISAFLSRFTQNSLVLFVLINLIAIALFKTIEEPLNHFIRNKYRLSRARKEVAMADKLN
ncbi:MAG: acyltransferase family protein, partial [Bacteroidia bacterium]